MNAWFAKPVCAPPADPALRLSVHLHCRHEEDKHRWIESEKARRDLGEEAVRQWAKLYWDDYLRHRWVEHLEGRQYWIELDYNDFGILQHLPRRSQLVNTIVRKLKNGEENLDILKWCRDCGISTSMVRDILEMLDCNRRRVPHRLERECPTRSL